MTIVFTETWTGTTGAAWPSAWSTESRNTIQSNRGQMSAPAFGNTSAYAALSPTLGDSEVVFSFTPDSSVIGQSVSLVVASRADSAGTVSNAYPPNTGISVVLTPAGASTLQRTVSGTTTFTGSGTTGSAWVAGTTYKLRYRVVGTHCQMRWWDSGGSEPSTWTLDITDASVPTTAGSLRLGLAGIGSVARLVNLDDLTVDNLVSATPVSGSDTGSGVDGFTVSGTVAPHTHAIADLQTTGTANGTDFLRGDAAWSVPATQAHTHGEADFTATGTRNSTTFLRGDNTWAVPPSGGGGSTNPVVFNVRDYGAVGDGTTNDTAAIQSAINAARDAGINIWGTGAADIEAHYHRGAEVYFPIGAYVINSPLILPRSGNNYRSGVVGLVGEDMNSSVLLMGGSFPTGRALVEWADRATTNNDLRRNCRDPRIANLTFRMGFIDQTMAVHFKIWDAQSTYTDPNNVDTIYGLCLENLVFTASNNYHKDLVRLEGRIDNSRIYNLNVDVGSGTAYTTNLLHLDEFDAWPQFNRTTFALYDYPGFNFGRIEILRQGVEGGNMAAIYGRVNHTIISEIAMNNGNSTSVPNVYIHDGGHLFCYHWMSEGLAENGIFAFENCWNVHLDTFNLGTVESGSPGVGLKLINVHQSRFSNRHAPAGSPSFASYGAKMVTVDANCTDVKFEKVLHNGPFSGEWTIDPAARGIEVDTYDTTNNRHVSIQQYGVHPSAAVSGGNLLLTGHPSPAATLTNATLVKDTWHFLPVKLPNYTPVTALKVQVATAASGGTATARLAVFSSPDTGKRPTTLVTDLSTYGTIDLTIAGARQVATSGLSLPPGEYWLGVAWSGTATSAPGVACVTGTHPTVAGTGIGADATAYTLSLSGASTPSTVSLSGTAAAGVAVYGALA